MLAKHNLTLLEELGISSSLLAIRGLSIFAEAERLEIAETGKDGREHLLVPEAAASWRTLKQAAHQEGIVIFILSAFRSVQRQAEIIRRKLEAGKQIEDILRISAPPGFSEHHTGRAIDISTPASPSLEIAFEQTPAFDWLQRNAGRFGFRLSYPVNNSQGYQYEPWHWYYHTKIPPPA